MIINGIIAVIIQYVGPLINRIVPPLDVGTLSKLSTTTALKLGHFLKIMSPVMPVTALVTWFTVLGAVLLARGLYAAFDFLFSHLTPVVADVK